MTEKPPVPLDMNVVRRSLQISLHIWRPRQIWRFDASFQPALVFAPVNQAFDFRLDFILIPFLLAVGKLLAVVPIRHTYLQINSGGVNYMIRGIADG